MEVNQSAKYKLFKNNNVMQRVLENYEKKELLEWRLFDKRVGQELVPRCIKELIYECPEVDDDDDTDGYTFHKILTYARKVEIRNIDGGEVHLNKIKEIAEAVGSKCEY